MSWFGYGYRDAAEGDWAFMESGRRRPTYRAGRVLGRLRRLFGSPKG